MSISRVGFLWGTPVRAGRWRLGLFLTYDRQSRRRGRSTGLVLSVRGLVLWGALVAAVAWVGGATALSRHLAKRPFNRITWADCVLLPLRWRTVEVKRGDAYIADGLQDFRDNRWREAAAKISAGLQRSPASAVGRVEAASVYLAMRSRMRAMAILEAGLDYPWVDREYVGRVVGLALEGENFAAALAVCDRVSARWGADMTKPDVRWLAGQRVTIYLRAERWAEALAAADAMGGYDRLRGEGQVLALVGLGRHDDAVRFLAEWARAGGVDAVQLELRARVLAEAGRLGELKAVLRELRDLSRMAPQPLIIAVRESVRAGDREAAEAWFEEFRLQFGVVGNALLAMGRELASVRERVLLERCIAVMAEHGRPNRALQLSYFQVLVERGELDALAAAAADLKAATPEGATPFEHALAEWAGVYATALIQPADAAQSGLSAFVRGRSLPMALLKSMHGPLMKAGRFVAAEAVAASALILYPDSQFLTTARAEAATAEAARSAEVTKRRGVELAEVATKKEAVETPAVPAERSVPVDEAAFLEALGAARRAGRAEEVLRLIATIRPLRPDWLSARDGELLSAEIEARWLQRDELALVAAVRAYANGQTARMEELLALARRVDAAGQRDLATRIVSAMVRRVPGHAESAALLKAWTDPESTAATGRP